MANAPTTTTMNETPNPTSRIPPSEPHTPMAALHMHGDNSDTSPPPATDESPSVLAVSRKAAPEPRCSSRISSAAIQAEENGNENVTENENENAPPKKRPRTSKHSISEDGRRDEEMDVEVAKEDKMEMETDNEDTFAGATPSPAHTPSPQIHSPTSEKLTAEETVNNSRVLAHLLAKAAKASLRVPSTSEPEAPPPVGNTIVFAPTPPEGFPHVHGRTSTHIFDNLKDQQMEAWLSLDVPHVFIQPLHHGYYPLETSPHMVHLITTEVKAALECTRVKVTAPIPATEILKVDQAPFTYLVQGISASNADKLVKQHCLASKQIGMLIFKAGIIAPTYLGSVEGLTVRDEADFDDAIRLIRNTYRIGLVGTILGEITASHPHLQNGRTPKDRTLAILDTLTGFKINLTAAGGTTHTCINIYIRSPTDDNDDWVCLLETVNKTIYPDPFLGRGYHTNSQMCNVCHSIDHPAGLCPFPNLPGWVKADPYKPIDDFHRTCQQAISAAAVVARGT
ncbi:hypothetical protein PILCRDRAFT_14400 [Piloderma croceum F 1598]|uniref:Uncharacterized protein n=1 Tax=Piloderma croceum (strain F 1598) TaxID=765440 RepID=A0A0C3AKQ8_PILCF|nr:hypothetical protein PILCRDRAFT_14400 [Piloderma croceum F 1598]